MKTTNTHLTGHRTLVPVLSIALGLLTSGQAQSFLVDGLVASYPFSGNANDASGNGHNGSILGSPSLTTDRFGQANSAYEFHAGSDTIALDSLPVSTTAGDSTTVAVWMKWDGTFYSPSDQGSIIFSFSPSYHLFIQGNTPGRLGIGTGNGDVWGINYDAGIINNWVHVVGVFFNGDTRQSSLYIDGVKMTPNMTMGGSPTSDSWSYSVSPTAMISGWDPNISSTTYRFSGGLDDVRIYDRALSETEVGQLYTATAVPEPTTWSAIVAVSLLVFGVARRHGQV
jgi:hypothetical protein